MNFRGNMKGHELETTTSNLEPTILLEGVTFSALQALSDDSIFLSNCLGGVRLDMLRSG